jgi:acetyl esterase
VTEFDSEVRALLDRWAAIPATPVSELTAQAVRKDDLAVLDLQRAPGELYSVEDIEAPGPAGTLPVRVYRPHPGRLHPVLFLHGGGFVIGREGYDAPLRELALASGCMIVAPECRLAPEHPFPAAADDALAAARWLCAEASALGASDTTAAVAGDSSGGNLAATVTHALSREGAPPSFQVLIYPMLDATASSASYDEFAEGYGFSSEKSRWYFDQYLPQGVDRRAPRVSPLFECSLSNLPATLIVTAECDPLRDDGERHAEALRQAGVTVELRRYRGTIHGFFQMTGALERSRRLHRELGAWMREAVDQAQRVTIGDDDTGTQ